jgi:hypothetical protein
LNCGEPFVPAKSTAKFCSYKCFLKYRRKEIADIKQEEKEKKKREHEEWQSLSSADKSLFGKMKERNPDLTRKEFLERLKQK